MLRASILMLALASASWCSAAVLIDVAQPVVHNDTAPKVAIDTFDLGYFKLESESCLPLGPAQYTITQLLQSRRLSTADAAALTFSWRQIQHHRAEAGKLATVQCYYSAH